MQERDLGVKLHKRKPWKRPQSDYGNRLGGRKKSDSAGEKANGGDGADKDNLLGSLEEDGSLRSGQGVGVPILGEGDDAEGDDAGGKTGSRGSSTESSRRK